MATNILSNNTPTNDQKNVFDAVFCDIYYCHKIHCSCKKCHHLKMSVWWPDHGHCWTYSTWLEFNVMLLHWFITYNNTEHDEGSFDQDYAIKVYVKSFICLLRSLSLPWLSCNLPIRVIYERPKVEKLQSMTDCGVNIWPGDMTLQRPEIISNNLCSALPRLINLMELKIDSLMQWKQFFMIEND